MSRFLITLLLMLSGLPLKAAQLQLDPAQDQQLLGNHIEYVEDSSHQLQVADILSLPPSAWTRNQKETFNQGYNGSIWWLRLRLQNPTTRPQERLLEIGYPVLDQIAAYIYDEAGNRIRTLRLGDKYPFRERPVDHRHFVIPLEWQPQQTLVIYLAVRSASSVQVPMVLWQEQAFYNHDRSQVLMHGVYYGIMLVMVMYNLFIFLAMGERNYLYYVLFVCCMPLFLASLTGFGFQYLWPEATRWNDQAILVTLAMAVCFGSLFTHNFLNATALHNFYRHLGQLLAAGAVLIAMLAMLLPYNVVIRILIPYAAVTCCYGFSLGIYRWVSGGISAKYYTIA